MSLTNQARTTSEAHRVILRIAAVSPATAFLVTTLATVAIHARMETRASGSSRARVTTRLGRSFGIVRIVDMLQESCAGAVRYHYIAELQDGTHRLAIVTHFTVFRSTGTGFEALELDRRDALELGLLNDRDELARARRGDGPFFVADLFVDPSGTVDPSGPHFHTNFCIEFARHQRDVRELHRDKPRSFAAASRRLARARDEADAERLLEQVERWSLDPQLR